MANKNYDQDYIQEKINLIKQATLLKNLNDIPTHSTKMMVARNLLAIEKELGLISEEEYSKKYLDVALERYTLLMHRKITITKYNQNGSEEEIKTFESGKAYTINEIDSALSMQGVKYDLAKELEKYWRMVD